VEDFRLLAQRMDAWSTIVLNAEHDARGFKKIIDELVQFVTRLSGVITMQKQKHG
jgi:hypothetical protein